VACRHLEGQPQSERKSLWGIPFAVKDNIDVAGFSTTAACRSFTYTPDATALAVKVLLDEGIFASRSTLTVPTLNPVAQFCS